jgi:adenylate cyclase
MEQHRQLVAILFTDIVGSTAIMHKDEQTAASMNRRYMAVLKESLLGHGGQILNDYGDGSLCTFSSVTQAVRCAIEIQKLLQLEPKVPLRMGLHLGEVFFDDGKAMGDSINIASRVQSLGIANSILLSSEIYSKIRNQLEFNSISLGRFEFKQVDEPMEVFALVNEGLVIPKKEEMIGKLKEIEKRSTIKRWTIAIIGAMLLGMASYFTYLIFFHSSGFSGEKTIAVLPFENLGPESNEEYVSDAITQDIIQSLSEISSIKKVIGWFSVKKFKNSTKSLDDIAKELDVAAIVRGSLQTLGEKTRIFVELIDANTKKRLWGDEREYERKDFLTVHSKLSREIANALQANITVQEKKELSRQNTDNPEAYKLYSKGLYFWNKAWQTYFDSAEFYFKQATSIDPDYALAYAGLANCYIFSNKVSSQLEGMAVAKVYLAKALALDSNLCEAVTTKGFIQSIFEYDWSDSKITLEKAIALNPKYADAHFYYGNLLQYTGQNTQLGIAEIKRALELDPLNPRFNWVLGRNYFLAGEDDLAMEQLRKTLILEPNYENAKGTLTLLYLKLKMYSQAFELIKQLSKNPTTNHWHQTTFLCYALALSGDTLRAKSILDTATITITSHLPFSYSYIALHRYDEAINLLEKAYQQREIGLYWVKIDPELDPIRNEPRFKALLEKMHLQ